MPMKFTPLGILSLGDFRRLCPKSYNRLPYIPVHPSQVLQLLHVNVNCFRGIGKTSAETQLMCMLFIIIMNSVS